MPTPPKQSLNSTKHRTREEAEARTRAEERTNPEREKVRLRKPKLVSRDKAANRYWNGILKEVSTSGAELLDNLDSEAFAGYCSQLAMRDRLAALTPRLMEQADQLLEKALEDPEVDPALVRKISSALKSCDALGKNRLSLDNSILSYAEKLGLTPSGRARLAVKRAQEETPDDMEALFTVGVGDNG